MTSRDSLIGLRDGIFDTFGVVDILINCAGVIKRTPTMSLTEQEWGEILDTNLTGTLRGCQVFGEPMLKR